MNDVLFAFIVTWPFAGIVFALISLKPKTWGQLLLALVAGVVGGWIDLFPTIAYSSRVRNFLKSPLPSADDVDRWTIAKPKDTKLITYVLEHNSYLSLALRLFAAAILVSPVWIGWRFNSPWIAGLALVMVCVIVARFDMNWQDRVYFRSQEDMRKYLETMYELTRERDYLTKKERQNV